ncbi:hypothetical protein BDU57DRAFT_82467 [Ampelomyces quisqualis]|uniref:Secreted protein n=1 Tax=Ampelomyces quisqualis TaxID=50730 RepID=A0A6A5Q9U0_AMPQU|nr:hypothetical protein BDU57DRAFT_82467 [Ampelomyces quisqualis]
MPGRVWICHVFFTCSMRWPAAAWYRKPVLWRRSESGAARRLWIYFVLGAIVPHDAYRSGGLGGPSIPRGPSLSATRRPMTTRARVARPSIFSTQPHTQQLFALTTVKEQGFCTYVAWTAGGQLHCVRGTLCLPPPARMNIIVLWSYGDGFVALQDQVHFAQARQTSSSHFL